MQEQGVGWDPAVIDRQMPWQSRFFLVYLLFVIGISLVRTASMVRHLWLLRCLASGRAVTASESETGAKFLRLYDACSAKVRSTERSVVLTFLLCVLMAADQTRSLFAGAALEKYTGSAYLFASVAEVLTAFAIGVLVCAVLYAVCDFVQGALTRRRDLWKASQPRTDPSA
jgi:hypothetical protein